MTTLFGRQCTRSDQRLVSETCLRWLESLLWPPSV